MSFRRRTVVLAAGAVAAAVVIASIVVYVVTANELRHQIDSSLVAKVTPGQSAAVQFRQVHLHVHVHARGGRSAGTTSGNVTFTPPGETLGGGGRVTIGPVSGAAATALAKQSPPGNPRPGGSVGETQTAVPLPVAVAQVGGVRVVLPRKGLGQAAGYAQFVQPGKLLLRSEDTGPGLPVSPATREVAAGRRGPFFGEATIAGAKVRTFTAPGPFGGVWQVALPLSDLDNTLANLRLVLALVCAGGIALAAALGLLVSRAALAPVRRLTRATDQVARTTDLGHRIHARGGDELGQLAASFNTMLAALERSRTAQRQLVSDASHELRTPLTSVRANLDALASGELDAEDRTRAIAAARAQLAELTVLVGDLVDLSKTGLDDVEVEDVRLDLAVAATVERARVLVCRSPDAAPDREIELDAEPCLVRAAPARLDRAVANLLDNACKWSPPGARVEVSVRDGRVCVRDHGPGFAPEDLPHVFDRFYRARAARALPGSGLGLAIVRQFAELHGGSASAENHPHGGAELTLRLPVCAAAVSDPFDAAADVPSAGEQAEPPPLAVHQLPRAL
jgi:two-component system sensor histidine kinase MprB